MITLPEYLEQPFLHIAEMEHKPVNKLIEQALTEFLEDYYDVQLAEAAIKRLQNGESELISLEDAERMLHEMDCKD
jgi:predicted DNA-binding protein